MNKQGLSLMEVIVSALILAVTVGGILYIFSTEKGVVARTGRRVQAMDFSRQTLEELKNAVGADTWPDQGFLGTVGAAITDPLDAGAFADKFGGSRSYEVVDIDVDFDGTTDYKQVSVTIIWEEPAEKQ